MARQPSASRAASHCAHVRPVFAARVSSPISRLTEADADATDLALDFDFDRALALGAGLAFEVDRDFGFDFVGTGESSTVPVLLSRLERGERPARGPGT